MSEVHLDASAHFCSEDQAEHHLSKRLRLIRNEQRIPLLCVDMDDTFLPFGKVITEHERDAVKAYLQAGGHIAFNTLAPKEWFYLRVIEPVALAFHEDGRSHLLSRFHWIVSGGGEVFVYEPTKCSYRRVHGFSARSKAEGLLSLLTHLGPEVRVLAFYGDRFDDPQNDGNAIGADHIPLVVNVGTNQIVASTPKQIFIWDMGCTQPCGAAKRKGINPEITEALQRSPKPIMMAPGLDLLCALRKVSGTSVLQLLLAPTKNSEMLAKGGR
jgi:hypothetical protein